MIRSRLLLRSRIDLLKDWIYSRTAVGQDKYGNQYFVEYVGKGKPEKRYCEYIDKSNTPDINTVPIEWWSWLHRSRDTVPTPAEIRLREIKDQELAIKVAKLEAEEEKNRLRQVIENPQGSRDETPQDMAAIFRQISAGEKNKNK